MNITLFNDIIFYSFTELACDLSINIIEKLRLSKTADFNFNIATGYSLYENSNSFIIPIIDVKESISKHFKENNVLVFIGSIDYVVRTISSYVSNINPTVIVIDTNGEYIVPILATKLGNTAVFTEYLSKLLHSKVVTTNDYNSFSLEMWAKENNYTIVNQGELPIIKNALKNAPVNNEEICVFSDYPMITQPPKRFTYTNFGKYGIYIINPFNYGGLMEDIIYDKMFDKLNAHTFYKHTLFLYPANYKHDKDLVVGINYNSTNFETIEAGFFDLLSKLNLDVNKVEAITSIDSKSCDEALTTFANKYNLPLCTYGTSELLEISSENDGIVGSKFLNSVNHVDNVSMRSAKLYSSYKFTENIKNIINSTSYHDYSNHALIKPADNTLGNFLTGKIIYKNITLSVFRQHKRVIFPID